MRTLRCSYGPDRAGVRFRPGKGLLTASIYCGRMTMPPDVNAVARWMADKVVHDGFLDQQDAVDAIERGFGEEFVYQNDSGGWSIRRNVLQAFRTLTEDTVVWDTSDKAWRTRCDDDGPGRQQD